MSLFEEDGSGNYMPSCEDDVDIYLELDSDGNIMPRCTPLDLNYPADTVVLDGVQYGFDNQFEGNYICLGGGPGVPEIALSAVGDESAVLEVEPAVVTDKVYILWRRTYSGESFTGPNELYSITGSGFITVTGLTNGISYDFLAISEANGSYSLPSELVTGTPEPAGLASSLAAGVFSRIWVDNLMEQGAIIYWELGNIPCDVEAPFYFNAQWAHTINGDWQDIGASPVVDGYYIIDPVKRLWAKQIDLYYRVRMTTGDGKIYYSYPVRADGGLPPKDWVIAKEITRKEYLKLVKYVGTKGELYRRRDWGDICPECTDYDTGERIKENCEVCWDTGYVNGYYPPVDFWIEQSSHQQRIKRDDNTGMNADLNMTGRAVPYPYPYSNDMWVSHEDGKRYFIQSVSVVAKIRGKPLIINVELKLIPASSILYKLL